MAESLPPLTAEDVEEALNNPTFTVYLYIGEELDRGWEVAQAAFRLLPRLRIYLVASRGVIPDWEGAPETKGVVFGFGPEPKSFLTEDETEDLLVVVEAVDAARGS